MTDACYIKKGNEIRNINICPIQIHSIENGMILEITSHSGLNENQTAAAAATEASKNQFYLVTFKCRNANRSWAMSRIFQ